MSIPENPRLSFAEALTLYRWGVNPFDLNEAYLNLPLAKTLPALARARVNNFPVRKVCAKRSVQLSAAAVTGLLVAAQTGRIRIPGIVRYGGLVFIGAGTSIVLTSAYQFAKYYLRKRAPYDVEAMIHEANLFVDSGVATFTDTDKAEAIGDSATAQKKRRFHFLPYCVRSIKSECGLYRDNAANRMVIRKKVANFATTHGIRPHHQQEFIDLAIDLILMPTRKDIASSQFKKSTTSVLREAEFAYWGGRKADL